MDFDTYQNKAMETAQYPEEKAIDYLVSGLSSENGEVSAIRKREIRGDLAKATKEDKISELGDVLWYLSELARKWEISLDEVAVYNLKKLADRKARNVIKGAGDKR